MTPLPPYEHLELRPEPDVVWHDDGDECAGPDCLNPAHFDLARKPGLPRAVLVWGFVAILLAVLAVALLVAAPSKKGESSGSTDRVSLAAAGPVLGSHPRMGTPHDFDVHRPNAGRSDRIRCAERTSTEALAGLPDTASAVTGWATFYDVAAGNAAAGPVLRKALGGDPAFRGRSVRVCAGERCLVTRLSDWCACGPRHGRPTLIDLARTDFARLSPTSRGVVLVTIDVVPFLPPTSTAR
jgi:hypothetical protein